MFLLDYYYMITVLCFYYSNAFNVILFDYLSSHRPLQPVLLHQFGLPVSSVDADVQISAMSMTLKPCFERASTRMST